MGFDFSSLSPWVGPATTLIGLLGGSNQPDPTKDPNYQAAQRMLSLQQALGGQYGNEASAAGGQFAAYNPQYLSAVNNEASYLKTDPYTDSVDANALNGATSGAVQAYQRGNANLTDSLASRGITDSSEMAGGLTGNADALAAQQASAENALADQKIATANQNRNALIGLLGGVANTDYARENAAMGAEGGVNNSVYNDYMNQEKTDLGLQQQANEQRSGLLSTLGSGISDALDNGQTTPLEDAQTAALYHSAGYVKNGDGDWVPGPSATPGSAPAPIAPAPIAPPAPGPTAATGGFGQGATPGTGFGGNGLMSLSQALGGATAPADATSPIAPPPITTSVPPPLPAAAFGGSPASPQGAPAAPSVRVIKDPQGNGMGYSLDGAKTITSDQAKNLGIPVSGKPNSPGYDGDGDLITSD